jgi:DNA segregation ATPase FtsK/SpoIIIE-like protein
MSKFDDDDYRDYDDDDDDDELDDLIDELDDDEDDLGPKKPSSNPYGSGVPRTNPPPGSGLQPRPSGLSGGGSSLGGGSPRPNLPGSPPSGGTGQLGGNRPNLPGSPPGGGSSGGGSFGSPRPNLPGSPPAGGTGQLGGNRPNLPGSPPGGGSSGGSSLGGGGSLGGNRPNLPGTPPGGGSSGGSSLGGGGSLGGNRPNLPGSPPGGGSSGGSSLGGNRPNLPGSPPAGGSSGSGMFGGSRPSDPPKSDGKPEEKKGGFGLGGFGKKDDDKKDDKPSGGGALGGLGSKLGGLGGFGKKDGDGDKKADKPSGGGALGGIGGALGGLGGFGKKDGDKGGDKPAGGNPLGGLGAKLPFGKKDDAKKDDKPSGGGFGGLGGFGKKDDGGAPKPGGGFGGGGASPSPLGSRPGGQPLGGGIGGAPAAGGKPAQPKNAKAEGGFLSRFSLSLPFGKKGDKPARAKTSKPVKVDQGGLSLDTRLDIIGVALTVVSLALLLSSLSPNQGALTGEVNRFLSYLFGWGALAIPVAALAIGVWLILRHFGDEAPTLQIPRIVGIVILFVALLTIFQYVDAFDYQIEPNADYLTALRTVFLPLSYNAGQGGGVIGAEIYYWLISSIGELGGFVILFVPIIVGLMLALSLSAAELALIIVSNVRNIQDGARQRAVRAAAERTKRQEALAAQRAQLAAAQPVALTAGAPPAEALPSGARPMLPGAVESPVPMQMPLTTQVEQRPIQITQAGRTVTATMGSDGSPISAPAAPAAFNRPGAPLTPNPAGPPIGASIPPPATGGDKPQERGGIGRMLPAAIAGGVGSAVKALTPTEESDSDDAKPEKRGGMLSGFAPKLPFGKRETTTPAANPVGTTPQSVPASSAAVPPSPTMTPPPPAIPPVSVRPPALGDAVAQAAPGLGRSGEDASKAPAPPTAPPRVGDLLRPASTIGASGAPAQAPTPAGTTPASSAPAASLAPRPSGVAGGLAPRPFTPSASPPAPLPAEGGSKPLASPPPSPLPSLLDDEDDEIEDTEDWKALPPAKPRGDVPAPARPADSPFAPRVMGARDPAQPAAPSTPAASSAPPSGWQERMATISGKLPGGDTNEASKTVASSASGESVRGELGRRPGMSSPFGRKDNAAPQMPRIVKLDENNNEIDDDDLEDDLPLGEASSMKPLSAAPAKPAPATPASSSSGQTLGSAPTTPPATPPKPGSIPQASFPPPARNPSPAFGKPDSPATDLPIRSPLKPSPPTPLPQGEGSQSVFPAASVGTTSPSSAPARPAQPPVIPPAPPAMPPAAERPAPIITQMSPPQQQPAANTDSAPRVRGRKEWRMPEPATLLKTGSDQELDHAMLLQRAKTIEETLDAFGAPGRVVEVRTGPVITQFGVEPDYLNSRGGKKARVKVSAIAQLDKDLQLALGAKSIRIEAPVPGKGYVGIEVPNDQAAVVQLRDVLESDQFRRIKSPLGIALGQGVDGTPVAADLTGMPHLLIAGTTGSGKSVCVNSIIASLLLNNAPERLKFIMVDPKRVELTAYNGIPHLVAPVVVELERIVGVLKWVTREMDDRYRRFSGAGARNIEDYNKHLPQGEPLMPYIVVIIDELADLMMLAPDETERVITRLAALARATGIHLVIATQRPSVDVVTGLIKANFPARIAFAVAGSVDSRVILDQPGAERLLGRGDMLYMSGDSPAPQRLQGVYVSDSEINNITRFWRQQMDDSDLANQGRLTLTDFKLDEMSAKDAGDRRGSSQAQGIGGQRPGGGQTSFWEGPSAYVSSSRRDDEEMVDEDGDGEDDMYDEAVALVRQLRKASVSLLQRRLRIGYTRAAKLIDVMEDRGIIGPSQSGSTPRDVIG